MWEKDGAICLEDWKVCLEEAEGEEPVIMKIAGRDRKENWVRSSPVTEVCLTFYGWEVSTENPHEVYLLRQDNERLKGERGLWGSLRQKWSVLAERLPKELRLFARLWEDPPPLCWMDWREDRERLAEWNRQYGFKEDFQTLYLYSICIDKNRRERGRINVQRRREWKEKGGFFLCLNEDRAYCFEDLLTDEKSVWAEWKYISQEITKEQPSLIHVRANYTCHGSPWSVYLVISYHLTEADQIELVRVSRSFVLLETANSYWKPGEKKFPGWFLDNELCLCNGGQGDLYIRGIAGERKLRPGEEMMIKMDEILL